MAELRLSYNPYRAETELCVRQNGEWTAVSGESSLLRFSGTRLQRWICPGRANGEPSFFDELRAATGDDDLEILFCGTHEDFGDLERAASEYARLVPDVSVDVRESANTRTNSSRRKFRQMAELADAAQGSRYHRLLPGEVWASLKRCTERVPCMVQTIALADWRGSEALLFAPDAWKLTCLYFPFEKMAGKAFREQLRGFAEAFARLPDRRFERERFLLLCVFDGDDGLSDFRRAAGARRVLLEKGVQDIPLAFLSREEFARLECGGADGGGRLREVRAAIGQYNERYAEQYRLRKLHDVLRSEMAGQGFTPGPRLFRMTDIRMHELFDPVSDAEVEQAYDWIVQLLDRMNHLLDISI